MFLFLNFHYPFFLKQWNIFRLLFFKKRVVIRVVIFNNNKIINRNESLLRMQDTNTCKWLTNMYAMHFAWKRSKLTGKIYMDVIQKKTLLILIFLPRFEMAWICLVNDETFDFQTATVFLTILFCFVLWAVIGHYFFVFLFFSYYLYICCFFFHLGSFFVVVCFFSCKCVFNFDRTTRRSFCLFVLMVITYFAVVTVVVIVVIYLFIYIYNI